MGDVECDYIQSEDSPWIDEVVYYGPKEDLQEGAIAEGVRILAIKELFRYEDSIDMAMYSFNDEPECRTSKGLDPDKKYIVIYNGDFLQPKIFEYGKADWPSLE